MSAVLNNAFNKELVSNNSFNNEIKGRMLTRAAAIVIEMASVKEANAKFIENESKQIASGKKLDREASMTQSAKYKAKMKELQMSLSQVTLPFSRL